MKNIHKYTIYLLIIFLLFSKTAYASCTDSEKKQFNSVKKEYTVKYELNETTEKYDLYFKAPLLNKFSYQIQSQDNLNCELIDDTTMKCVDFIYGNYEILVVGITDTCDDVLKIINIKLPKFNTLSKDPLCEGIEDFVLCRPTYDKEISYEDFVSRVNTYKKNHSKEKEDANDPNNNGQTSNSEENNQNEFLTKVLDYIQLYLLEIIITIIFLILLIITIIIVAKSVRKSRRLE